MQRVRGLVLVAALVMLACPASPRVATPTAVTDCGATDEDASNCGACGHSCRGGACHAGRCGPITLASGQGRIVAIAADDEWARWVDEAAVLHRVALEGGIASDVAKLELAPVDMHVHGDVVFTCDEGGVMRVDADRHAQRVFAGTQRCTDVTGDAQHLFFVDDDGIVRALAYAGGAAKFVAKGEGGYTRHLEVRGNFIYYRDHEGVLRAPLEGGSVERVAKGDPELAFTLSGSRLVTLEPYVPVTAKNDPGAHVSYALFAKDLASPADVPHRLAVRLIESFGLTADARHAYFAMGGSYGAPVVIQRAHVETGGVETIVGDGQPSMFALGPDVVVWHDEETHEIKAIAK